MLCEEPIYFENLEGRTEWNIPQRFWENRRPGLSAMMRVKNEGDFLAYSVASIIDWHDEVCLFLQGRQDDNTPQIAAQLAQQHPQKVRVFHYPFESRANGPGHDEQVRGSLHERAYFYNWCLAHTTCAFANKWDGDMIAYEWLGKRVRQFMRRHDGVRFAGLDLAGPDLKFESGKRHTANELRVHRVTAGTYYFTERHCEHFAGIAYASGALTNVMRVTELAFLHLKWCKSSLAYSGVGWPEDWLTADPYYRAIYEGKQAARPYRGEYPAAIKPYMAARARLAS